MSFKNCPTCSGRMGDRSIQCSKCSVRHIGRGKSKICPLCEGVKSYTSERCQNCARTNGWMIYDSHTIVCERCGETVQQRGPLQRWCSSCTENPVDARRLYQYGVALEPGTKCEICGNPAEAVDHDHKTGRTRGFLCGLCNRQLGIIENDEWVCKAQNYLIIKRDFLPKERK